MVSICEEGEHDMGCEARMAWGTSVWKAAERLEKQTLDFQPLID